MRACLKNISEESAGLVELNYRSQVRKSVLLDMFSLVPMTVNFDVAQSKKHHNAHQSRNRQV